MAVAAEAAGAGVTGACAAAGLSTGGVATVEAAGRTFLPVAKRLAVVATETTPVTLTIAARTITKRLTVPVTEGFAVPVTELTALTLTLTARTITVRLTVAIAELTALTLTLTTGTITVRLTVAIAELTALTLTLTARTITVRLTITVAELTALTLTLTARTITKRLTITVTSTAETTPVTLTITTRTITKRLTITVTSTTETTPVTLTITTRTITKRLTITVTVGFTLPASGGSAAGEVVAVTVGPRPEAAGLTAGIVVAAERAAVIAAVATVVLGHMDSSCCEPTTGATAAARFVSYATRNQALRSPYIFINSSGAEKIPGTVGALAAVSWPCSHEAPSPLPGRPL
ncbi:hypothetical protein FBY30_3965 [Arthrobacter sp. SLBN-83]|uniref:hypothetical protein n=1 Tax=Arthrobacter sp. SLBN-83 TaxID=2768449 RepID=UPI00116AA6E4|nr:hypothetical protein [Arthrobacter sp. SLBN-83]TQJ61654.1 hypothetical protein FBY30_3965 [Arthrobacter sp. SLBN-83]